MKTPLTVSLLALLVSGLGLLLATLAGSPLDERSAGDRSPAVAGPDADLLRRIAELAEETRVLRERLAELELRPVTTQRAPLGDGGMGAAVTREEFEALGRPVDVGRSLGTDPSPAELDAFREHVAGVILDLRRDEAVGLKKKHEDRVASLDDRLPGMAEWLGLTPYQTEKMRSVLLAQYGREGDILRRWEEGEDADVLGAMKRDDRAVHEDELAEVLTPEQFRTYTSREWGGAVRRR